jgi:hypothetical protein
MIVIGIKILFTRSLFAAVLVGELICYLAEYEGTYERVELVRRG